VLVVTSPVAMKLVGKCGSWNLQRYSLLGITLRSVTKLCYENLVDTELNDIIELHQQVIMHRYQ